MARDLTPPKLIKSSLHKFSGISHRNDGTKLWEAAPGFCPPHGTLRIFDPVRYVQYQSFDDNSDKQLSKS